jgi:hypothetical protein
MSNTKRSAQEMVQALECWGVERGPRLRELFAPLREAAAKEAAQAGAIATPKPTRNARADLPARSAARVSPPIADSIRPKKA